jgi:hypothetical protein
VQTQESLIRGKSEKESFKNEMKSNDEMMSKMAKKRFQMEFSKALKPFKFLFFQKNLLFNGP